MCSFILGTQFMHKKITYYLLLLLFVSACRSGETHKKVPAWVSQRPVNDAYYIGIGIVNKQTGTTNYQATAKKEALNDLISEIKVTVSSNSVLQQMQNNAEFKQQFESQVKVTALNEIENYEVAGSWENETNFWIYLRLNKAQYAELRRRRMQSAIERAEDFFSRAEAMNMVDNYAQVLKLKLKALATLQDYLNEEIITEHKGKQVYLVNEILASIQQQLFQVKVRSLTGTLTGKVGKPIQTPFDVMVLFNDSTLAQQKIAFVPMTMKTEQGRMEYGTSTETDHLGIASFSIGRILGKEPIQLLRIGIDVSGFLKTDSLNFALKNVLKNIDVPSTLIRVQVQPIKVFVQTIEKNLSKDMGVHPLENLLKRQLGDAGCNFVTNKNEADYVLMVNANTKPLGVIWGNMQTAALDATFSLIDQKSGAEIFKDAIQDLRGFQTTPENAGLDAYKTAQNQATKNVIPKLLEELLKVEK